MLRHVAIQVGPRWHTAYATQAGGAMSVLDAPTQGAAAAEARRLNDLQERQARAAAQAALHSADRKIPAGMYSDRDAAA